MSSQRPAHEAIAWAKQRLDDVDAIIAKGETISGSLQESARKAAEEALTRLRVSRAQLRDHFEALRTRGEAARQDVADAQRALEAKWIEVETDFQSLLSAMDDEAGAARDVVVARAQAQRRAWETSYEELRQQAAEVLEETRGEFDAAIQRLSGEVERLQGKIGNAREAGDTAWSALKEGLADAQAIHSRTIEKIKNAFSKLL